MLVSDASGQTGSENQPSQEILQVAFRANNILMARVREAEFRELELLRRSSALNGMVFLHLKKDLEAAQIDWVDCQDPNQDDTTARNVPLTTYGIPRSVQTRLAAIRTDLDSFSDTEGYALMLSGYKMMTNEAQSCLSHLPLTDGGAVPWSFLAIEDTVMRAPGKEAEHADLLRQLTASANQLFKVWQLRPWLKWLAAFVAVILAGLALAEGLRQALGTFCPGLNAQVCNIVSSALGGYNPEPGSINWFSAALAALLRVAEVAVGIAAASIVLWLAHRAFRSQKGLTVIVTGLMVVTVGWLIALFHLFPLNWLYLHYGKVKIQHRP
jgi:hypothetical protein